MADDGNFDGCSKMHCKKKKMKLKKAPQAPKRFKSAYMFFSIEKHREIREELGEERASKERTTSVAKMVSEAWKNISDEERDHWETIAQKDKARYDLAKSTYTGPWKVPVSTRRRKKDPTAPKRPMSSYLAYSKKNRSLVKANNPYASNTEISRMVSRMWKEEKEEVRNIFIEEEAILRKIYKEKMAIWQNENKAGKAASLKKQSNAPVELLNSQSEIAESNWLTSLEDQVLKDTLSKRDAPPFEDELTEKAGFAQNRLKHSLDGGAPNRNDGMDSDGEHGISQQYDGIGGAFSRLGHLQQNHASNGLAASIEAPTLHNLQKDPRPLPQDQQVASFVSDPRLTGSGVPDPPDLSVGAAFVPMPIPSMGQENIPLTQANSSLQVLHLQNSTPNNQRDSLQVQLGTVDNNVLEGHQAWLAATGQNPLCPPMGLWNIQHPGNPLNIQHPGNPLSMQTPEAGNASSGIEGQIGMQGEEEQTTTWPFSGFPN